MGIRHDIMQKVGVIDVLVWGIRSREFRYGGLGRASFVLQARVEGPMNRGQSMGIRFSKGFGSNFVRFCEKRRQCRRPHARRETAEWTS